ncbi:MAG: hypothetical protein ABIJ96_03535 [Elusimicrobiota bacterium]
MSALEKWGALGFGQLDAMLFRPDLSDEERLRLYRNEYPESAYDGYGYKRLNRLEQAGLIAGCHSHRLSHPLPKAYALRRPGQTVLKCAGRLLGVGLRRRWSTRVIPRYTLINGMGLAVSRHLKLPVFSRHELEWEGRAQGLSEREIRESPVDLRVKFSPLWDFVVVDHYKLAPRLLKREREGAMMLYLLQFPALMGEFFQAAKKTKAAFMYACDLEEFQTDPARAPFKNAWGDTMRLGEAKFRKAGRARG